MIPEFQLADIPKKKKTLSNSFLCFADILTKLSIHTWIFLFFQYNSQCFAAVVVVVFCASHLILPFTHSLTTSDAL